MWPDPFSIFPDNVDHCVCTCTLCVGNKIILLKLVFVLMEVAGRGLKLSLVRSGYTGKQTLQARVISAAKKYKHGMFTWALQNLVFCVKSQAS